jgi:hypothetical protein
VLTTNTKCLNQGFNVWLVDLQPTCANYGLETWFSPNDNIRKCLTHIMHGSVKNAFWDVNIYKLRNGVILNHLSYLITLMVYLRSHWTRKFQNKYFMFGWSIYRLFVPNTASKRDSFQMMIFVIFCSTWCMVQLKTRFETWISRNDAK